MQKRYKTWFIANDEALCSKITELVNKGLELELTGYNINSIYCYKCTNQSVCNVFKAFNFVELTVILTWIEAAIFFCIVTMISKVKKTNISK